MSSFVLLGSIASIISAVSSVISIVVLAFVLLGAFLAYRRGFARSTLRLGTLIATIVLAVIGTSFLKGLVGGFFEGTVNDVLAEEGLTSITEASCCLAIQTFHISKSKLPQIWSSFIHRIFFS